MAARDLLSRLMIFALVGMLFFSVSVSRASADRLVLRNLTIIRDQRVVGFDEDGVRLGNKRVVPWDEIEQGTVAKSQQKAFDKMLAELGKPLYRIRSRLKIGDYKGLLPLAETLHPRYVNRKSKTAYMVLQSLMWARLETGHREAAVAPYLRCFEILRTADREKFKLPGTRRLTFDPKTGMTPELLPVWFDAKAAKVAMPDVVQAATTMQRPRPEAVLLYYGTLALAAGEDERAKRFLCKIQGNCRSVQQLRDMALAWREVREKKPAAVAHLKKAITSPTEENKPLAAYWAGMASVMSPDKRTRQEGVVQLLHVPALWGTKHPELAAASLYHAMQTLSGLDDAKGAISVRKELLDRYGHTYYATKVKAKSYTKQTRAKTRSRRDKTSP